MKRALVAVVVLGCRGDPPASTATVTLLDPGREPRVERRYAPRGDVRHVRFAIPNMAFTVDWRLERAEPARYHFQCTHITSAGPLPGNDEQAVIDALASGSKGDLGADVHGRVTGVASDTSSTVQELLGMVVVPFPAAPIGVGARWHVGGRMAPGLRPLDASLDYELVAVVGDQVDIRWSGHAEDETHDRIDLDGTATVRPNDLLPISAEFDEHTTMADPSLPAPPMIHTTLR
jgi:hypothetical protein